MNTSVCIARSIVSVFSLMIFHVTHAMHNSDTVHEITFLSLKRAIQEQGFDTLKEMVNTYNPWYQPPFEGFHFSQIYKPFSVVHICAHTDTDNLSQALQPYRKDFYCWHQKIDDFSEIHNFHIINRTITCVSSFYDLQELSDLLDIAQSQPIKTP